MTAVVRRVSRLVARGLGKRRVVIALWALAVLAAGTLAGALLWPRDDRQAQVAAYIERVNEAQAPYAVHYGAIAETYRTFTLDAEASAEQLPALRRSARRLAAVRVAVERIDAPPEATALRYRTIELLRHQEALAEEMVLIAGYLPKLERAEQPLAGASNRLRTRLQAAPTPEAQAVALRSYTQEVARVRQALEAIAPPQLLAPSHRTYVAQLRSHAALSQQLQAALASGEREAVERAVERLRTAGAEPRAARAQREAVEAYGARVAEVRTLATALEEERVRLQRELG